MSEHAYVVLFVSARACGRECAAYESVDMKTHVSEKSYIYIYMHMCGRMHLCACM